LRTYIEVPFKDKDAAKNKGARFDMAAKKWFVPDGIDLAEFKQWLPVQLQDWCQNFDQKPAKGHR
jgi:hypothetical protein